MLYPLGYAIWLSLFNYDLGSGTLDFIGLGNYAALLADARFWDTLNRTLLIVWPPSGWSSALACSWHTGCTTSRSACAR